MKKIAVFTSGGDSPGMNANVRAVVRAALHYGIGVMGIRNGYEGMIDGDMYDMTAQSVSGIIQQGGTILGTARSPRFMTSEGRAEAYKNLQKFGVEGIVACGGNGTFTGASVFMREYPDIRIVGTPGTIDNDLYGTDFTIGYDTAINTAMAAVDNIKDTANAHGRVFFVEVMGRHAGFIALQTALATGAEAVLIPETDSNLDNLVAMLNRNHTAKKRANVVIVAEGDEAGGAFKVVEAIKSRLLATDIRVTVLGHVQRGGRPTVFDRVLASQLGAAAVLALKNGKKGVALGLINGKVTETSFEDAIAKTQHLDPVLAELVDILQ